MMEEAGLELRPQNMGLAGEIFDDFMYLPRGEFPQDDLEHLLELQEDITPLLLEYLAVTPDEIAANKYESDDTADFRFMFSLFLLGQFREQAAFPKLVALFSYPSEKLVQITGDFITEDLKSVLAATYNDDFSLLSRLIEQPEIDEYVRDAALRTMLILCQEQRIATPVLHEYLHKLLDAYPAQAGYEFWSLALGAIAELQMDDIYEKLLKIHDTGVIDTQMLGREDLQKIHAGVYSDKPQSSKVDVMTLKGWYWFRDSANNIPKGAMSWPGGGSISWPDKGEEPEFWEKALQHIDAVSTYVRSESKVGRNDPCPCGSGKKYKKCCYGNS